MVLAAVVVPVPVPVLVLVLVLARRVVQRAQLLRLRLRLRQEIRFRIYAWDKTQTTSLCLSWRRLEEIMLEAELQLELLLLSQTKMTWMTKGPRVIAGRMLPESQARARARAREQVQVEGVQRQLGQQTGQIANTANA